MIYNSNQVAELIGVNVSTIKRWTDTGKLNCIKSAGGHRKFHLNHIKQLLKSNKKMFSKVNISKLVGNNKLISSAVKDKKYNVLINACMKHLLKGDTDNFCSLCKSFILAGYELDMIFDKIINPTLDLIGKKWENKEIAISEEHMASVIIKKFLTSLNENLNVKNSNEVFCFTLYNDGHDLPLFMAENILNDLGYKVFNLGSNLPVYDFLKFLEKHNSSFIFLSIVYVEDIDKMNDELRLLSKETSKKNIKVYLKGAGTDKLFTDYSNFLITENFKKLINELKKNNESLS